MEEWTDKGIFGFIDEHIFPGEPDQEFAKWLADCKTGPEAMKEVAKYSACVHNGWGNGFCDDCLKRMEDLFKKND